MSRYRHALVIGKFYPPHRGHHSLIREACEHADKATAVVMASGAESIPLRDRAAWLRCEHGSEPVIVAEVQCEAPLDLYDANVWAAQVAAIRAALRSVEAGPVDVVLSGEDYGRQLAGYFGADHVLIGRAADLVSGTAVRADVVGHWDDLSSFTRAGLACRVVFLGAESSGSSTLAGAVASHYRRLGGVWARTAVVGEYGRDYTSELWAAQRAEALAAGQVLPSLTDVAWQQSDFDAVARRQTSLEEEAARAGSPLLVCDTDAFATAVWERRYLGSAARPDPVWARPPALARHDLYLLTSHAGVPWVDDGIREGDLAVRAAMTDWFADALTRAGHPWVMLEGTLEERIALAIRSIEPVLRRRLTLADPLSGPGFAPTEFETETEGR